MGGGGDDGGAGFRANMERRRIINARETAMRQRKWKEMKLKMEDEDKKQFKDALDRRKRERARLTAYLHPPRASGSSQKVELQPTRKEQDFTARLKEDEKSATENSNPWDQCEPMSSCQCNHGNPFLGTASLNTQNVCSGVYQASNLVLGHGNLFLEREPNHGKRFLGTPERASNHSNPFLGTSIHACSPRYQFINAPEMTTLNTCQHVWFSGSNSSRNTLSGNTLFAATSVTSCSPGMNEVGARPMTADCNIGKSRRGSPGKSCRVTFDPAFIPKDTNVSCAPRDAGASTKANTRPQSPTIVLDGPDLDSSSNSSFLAQNIDESNSKSRPAGSVEDMNIFLEEALKLRLDTETETTRMIAELTGLGSRLDECGVGDGTDEQRVENRFLSMKVHRSEAWETSTTENETSSTLDFTKRNRSETGVIVHSGFFSVFPSRPGSEKRPRPGNRSRSDSKRSADRSRKADLIALSEQENSVVASIERLDFKLASAIARCREVGVCDGHFSSMSAPTIVGHSSRRGRDGRRYGGRNTGFQTSRPSAAYSTAGPVLTRKRQNVGLTNKCLEKLDTKSQLRIESESPQVMETEPPKHPVVEDSHRGFSEGVIVFHPDAYHLLNPVGSP